MEIFERAHIATELLEWTRDWCELLALGRFADACARLDGPNPSGKRWSADSLVARARAAFDQGSGFAVAHPEGVRFTSPRAAAGRERSDFGALADGSGFWLTYDVPLNGMFSDLTAQFELHWRGARSLTASLHDLHVM